MITLREMYIIKIKNRYHLVIQTNKGWIHDMKITRMDVDALKAIGIKVKK